MTTTFASPKTDTDPEASPRPYHWTVDAYYRAGDAGVFEPDSKPELIRGRIIDRFAGGGPAEYRWTADTFDRACDEGVFGPDARLELIHGRIIDRMGQGPLHLSRRVRIGRRLRVALEPRFFVVDECSVRIVFDGEPVMNIAVLRGADGDYDTQNPVPEDVALAVEVAVSSENYDLGGKALLYAQAGLSDYWAVLPEAGAVIVHRGPTPNGYASVVSVGAREAIAPLAASETFLSVRDLLGLAATGEGAL